MNKSKNASCEVSIAAKIINAKMSARLLVATEQSDIRITLRKLQAVLQRTYLSVFQCCAQACHGHTHGLQYEDDWSQGKT
ncbi:MAG: hypothetical protein ABI351_11345 [Herbaspirillum sp.]